MATAPDDAPKPTPKPVSEEALIEGVDYTIDPKTGFFVFTRDYLLKRGTCCNSDCRNCPWRARPDSGTRRP